MLLEGDEDLMGEASRLVSAVIRKYVCTHCNAQVGEPCRDPSGRVSSLEHAARRRAAYETGDLPIDLGEFY